MFNINPLNNLGRAVQRTVTSGRPSFGALGGIFSMLKLTALGVAVLSLVSPATLQRHIPDWNGGTGVLLIAVAGLALLSSVFRTLRGTFGAFMWLAVLAIMGKSIFLGRSSNISLPKNPISNSTISGVMNHLNPFAKAPAIGQVNPEALGISEQLKDPELSQVVKVIENSWLGEDSDMKFDTLNDKGGDFVELMTTKRGVRQIVPHSRGEVGGTGNVSYRMRGDQQLDVERAQGQTSAVSPSGAASSLGGELVELFSNKTKGLVKRKPGQEHDLTYSTQSVFGAQSGLGASLGASSLSDVTIVGRGDNIYFAKPSRAKLGASIGGGDNSITSKISDILGR